HHGWEDNSPGACGNARGYARGLALLEESRSASLLAMAASGGVLTTRIGRLLGVKRATRSMSVPSVAMLAALSIAGALRAGPASRRAVDHIPNPPAPPAPVELTSRAPPNPPPAPAVPVLAVS